MRIVLMVVFALGLVVACSAEKRDVKDTVFAPQVRALEKARAVEDQLKKAEQRNRDAVEQAIDPGEKQ